ncbi:cytochrome [Sesamum alatum]|uniref:Cytochrome n=1 Tax=Sesamum alatum TaxID=300844 RepID=A0AAE2C9Q9_9LAMI|nr:cytochrome [Sesamum alatum]
MGKEIVMAAEMVFSLVLGGFLLLVLRFFDALLLKPRRLRSRLEKQGIRGPQPSFLYGNIAEMKRIIEAQRPLVEKSAASEELVHACSSSVFPHVEQWRQEYDLEMVKEVALCTSLNLGKPTFLSTERGPLLGRGILSSNGPYWAYQRKIIGPELYLDRVKGMVNLMAESTSTMLRTWENRSESWERKVEMRVDGDLRRLSADIISRACFGRSYTQGEKIFSKLHALQKILSKGKIGVPGLRYIPNKHNKEIWKLEHEIDSMILEVVKSRSADDENKSDLLQSILSTAEIYGHNGDMPANISLNKFIVDNCKNIFFAGHETTTVAASWCLTMLAAYPDWQARARKEVIEICGTNVPTANMLRNMKVLTMVIQETLRLYPPIAYLVREALKDIHFKGINIPKGITIQVPTPILHQHQELWGSDAHEFKPDRFANGTSGACKIPQAYMPFGVGPRTCAGQNFAMAELKVILSLILSKFSFTLSPAYHHSPVFRLLIQPQHGVSILLEKL